MENRARKLGIEMDILTPPGLPSQKALDQDSASIHLYYFASLNLIVLYPAGMA